MKTLCLLLLTLLASVVQATTHRNTHKTMLQKSILPDALKGA